MKKYVSIFILYIVSPLIAMAAEESPEAEPVQNFILKIDNVPHAVSINSNHKIEVSGKSHKIRIELSPTREFSKAGIMFEFDSKRHFSYEALSPAVDHWTLDGNNTVIIIQNYKVDLDNSEIIDSFKDQYKKMKAKSKWAKTKLKAGGNTITGERLLLDIGEVKLEQQLFFFKRKGETRVLILQDAPDENNRNTKEFIKMRNLVQQTLSVDS